MQDLESYREQLKKLRGNPEAISAGFLRSLGSYFVEDYLDSNCLYRYFIPGLKEGQQLAHYDGKKANNTLKNTENMWLDLARIMQNLQGRNSLFISPLYGEGVNVFKTAFGENVFELLQEKNQTLSDFITEFYMNREVAKYDNPKNDEIYHSASRNSGIMV